MLTLRVAHVLLVAACSLMISVHSRASETSESTPQVSPAIPDAVDLEPPFLKFSEIFVMPVGPKGLEYTDRVKSLDGQKVRMQGYMALRSQMVSGQFIMTPMPIVLHDAEMGPCDDLPPTAVWVHVPGMGAMVTPHEQGLIEVSGVVSLGPREEADGRVSSIRIELDELKHVPPPPQAEPRGATAPKVN